MQKKDVNVHIVIAETEGNVLSNIQRKDKQAQEMKDEMLYQMRDFQSDIVNSIVQNKTIYQPTKKFIKPTF